MRKTLTAAVALALTVGFTPSAQAANRYYPAAVLYEHIGWAGESLTLYRRDFGACSATRYYSIPIPTSWRSRVSSVRTIDGSSCNHVIAFGPSYGTYCGEGHAPGIHFLHNCNDDAAEIGAVRR
jgi:hypothetical protein